MPIDLFQRKIDYLRLSVTDRCNLRCRYCMPLAEVQAKDRDEILTFDEIERLVRILAALGIRRVRITGGEPLVRKNLPLLIQRLNRITGIEEVLMTTNGILLESYARELVRAGLRKINIHLDTLNAEKFKQITRWGDIQKVFNGIEKARQSGFQTIKLNTVLQKGFNDDEIDSLLQLASRQGLILRLIELMPIGPAGDRLGSFMPAAEAYDRLREKYTLLPAAVRPGSGPAVYYRVKELETLVGFISPVSRPFCQTCNRIRISSDGRFQDCLAFDGNFSLRDLLRNPGLGDLEIADEILKLFREKRKDHNNFVAEQEAATPCMYGIGG